MDQNPISIKCIEVTQPIGTFYIGVINSSDLVEISYADIRKLDRELDDYMGIQRKLSPNRVEELKRYVNTIDATFPTAVILAISSDYAKFYSEKNVMEITRDMNVAKIIDGQHRIKGLEGYSGENFDINVTVFIDMEIEDQAMVFATINLAQTKVNKSLVYDLYEYTKTRSPQKTSHNIVRMLNTKENSPFYHRIKILGTADPESKINPTITQATFVQAILKLISGSESQALSDRDTLKKGKTIYPVVSNQNQLIFRSMFINKQDAMIAQVIWAYFEAIQERWPISWNSINTKGNILPRTNGFRAMMRLLPIIYERLRNEDPTPNKNAFLKILQQIPQEDGSFITDTYKPGTSGEKDLFTELSTHVENIKGFTNRLFD